VQVTRARFGSLLEWAVAALCALALAAGGSFAVHHLGSAPGPVVPVAAEEVLDVPLTTAYPPASVPSKAVSVPLVVLSTGSELRLGEMESVAAGKLKPAWRVGGDVLERGAAGNRITRTYDDSGHRFILVLEPPTGGAERRISALYVR